jgi:purine nucleoside phosphorylase
MDVEFLQYTGAIVATMSGAPEVTRANEIGLPAVAVAVVTNPCTGIDASIPAHTEVLAASGRAAGGLGRVISQFIGKL